MKINKSVCILWLDAYSQDEWVDKEEALKFAKTSFLSSNRTYGEIIEETKDYILIGGSFTETKDLYGDLIMIPKKMIRKVKILK